MLTANICFAFLYGLIVGSFLNCFYYRWPRHESLVSERSHCTTCGATIRFYDNIPVFSYLFLHGRCRMCQARIPWRYPLVELVTGLLFVTAILVVSLPLAVLLVLVLVLLFLVFLFALQHHTPYDNYIAVVVVATAMLLLIRINTAQLFFVGALSLAYLLIIRRYIDHGY